MCHCISWTGYLKPSIICPRSVFTVLSLPAPHAYTTDLGSHYLHSPTLSQSGSPFPLLLPRGPASPWPPGIFQFLWSSLKSTSTFSAINPMLPHAVISYFHGNIPRVLIFIVYSTNRAFIWTFLKVFMLGMKKVLSKE